MMPKHSFSKNKSVRRPYTLSGNAVKLILCFVPAVASLLLSAFLFFSIAPQATSFFSDEEAQAFNGSFTVDYANGNQLTEETPFIFRGKKGETSTLTRVLQKGDFPGFSFMLYAWSSYHRVTLNGKVLYELHANEVLPDMAPSSGWIFVTLPPDYVGKELCIEITPQVNGYEQFEISVLCGTKTSLIYHVINKAKYFLLLSFIIFVFGAFILVAAGLIKKTDLHPRALLLGLACVCAGIWIFCESGSSQLFFDNRFFISMLCSTNFFLLPVISTALLMTYHDFKTYKPFKILFVLFTLLFLFTTFFNTFGIISWLNMVPLLHILVVLTFVAVACKYWVMRQNKKTPNDFSLIHGLAIFAVFITLDIVAYFFDRGDQLFFSRIGLFFLFVTLFINIAQLVQKAHEEEIYERLAYEDLMTGCKNRTAFEEEKEYLKSHDKSLPIILFLSDMNNLKTINDVYGHSQGDYAIRKYASYLKEVFADYEVYRIGGDEFCVIAKNCSMDDFSPLTKALDERIKHSPAGSVHLSAAYSYHQTTGADIDNVFSTVDKDMYQNKKMMKAQPSYAD